MGTSGQQSGLTCSIPAKKVGHHWSMAWQRESLRVRVESVGMYGYQKQVGRAVVLGSTLKCAMETVWTNLKSVVVKGIYFEGLGSYFVMEIVGLDLPVHW